MLTASNLPAGIDWRLGEWQREMRDVKGDMLLADAPYGKRTHEGYRTGSHAVAGAQAMGAARAVGAYLDRAMAGRPSIKAVR